MEADIGDRNNGGISIVGTTIYVESFAHKLFAFDALTGQKWWEQELDGIAMATPVVDRGIVYAGTGTQATAGSVYAVDSSTGRVVWIYKTIGHDMVSAVLLPDEFVFYSDRIRALIL